MKSSRLLCLHAPAAVLAVGSLTDFSNFGTCKFQQRLLLSSRDSQCDIESLFVQSVSNESQISISSSPVHRWTRTGPCVSNATVGREYCVYYDAEFANGRGIIFMTDPERAADFISRPALANSSSTLSDLGNAGYELNVAESKKWRVEPVESKGMGLVATKSYEIGDHIMSTTATIMIDWNMIYDIPEKDLRRLQAEATQLLPPHHHALFMNLSTHDQIDDHTARINRIIATNSFDIESDLVKKRSENDHEAFYSVFPEISRLNHDCRSNADYYFDRETMTHNVHAVRRINAGEEITISYIDPIQTRKARVHRLQHSWHFPCSCSLCTQNDVLSQASDARIRQAEDLRRQLRDYSRNSQATPAMGELLISLYEQERLWSHLYLAYTYAALEYNGDGQPWMATKYAQLAIQHGVAAAGPDNLDVKEMTALVEDPWEHWSWMLRTWKRMNWGSSIS